MGKWEPTQQETMGKQFPIRHEAMVHHLNRKLLAKGFPSDMGAMVYYLNRKRLAKSFLSGMGLMRIISTRNYWRTVSCSACEQWEPPQQETICEKFPVRHGANTNHLNRKRLAKSFLSGMRLWCIISIGNYWRTVSCPTWGLWCINSTGNDLRKVSCPAWGNWIHLNRKLLADRFLSGMGLMRIISTGNYWRKVSCPAWENWIHLNRKLFADRFLSGM